MLMRLKGLGLSVGGKQGDQFVKIKVEIPKDLTDEQRKLLEGWE
jgi:DnaJ-class molecular chaperone